jgi:Fe(3+) dicitrate transport protein
MEPFMKKHTLFLPILTSSLIASFAQETVELPSLEVLGSQEAVRLHAGSAVYLSKEDLELQYDLNVNKMLNRVPGVFVREEDGFGNFPNISLRGADGTRAEKVTVMEDSVLAAPAPYSAPGAYYSPTAARMSGIEVLKGSSQVRFGPHTTGGALNYLSTPIPNVRESKLRFQMEEYNTQSSHFTYGNTRPAASGTWGYLFEIFQIQSDGFRSIGKVDGDTGFERIEPMLKLFWQPDTAVPQRFEFKYGFTDFEANESYLGLSEADVDANPYTRYAASQFDNIDTEHHRSYLRYEVRPQGGIELESTLYYNKFKRNWYKIDQVSMNASPEIDSRGRISDRSSLHTGLLDSGITSVLKGESKGSIGVKANRRLYESYGWQNRLSTFFSTGDFDHALSIGLRIHEDYIDRYQEVDVFSGSGNGRFSPYREGTPGEEADRRQETLATSLYIEDEISSGPLTLKPGVRWEFLDQRVDDRGEILEGSYDTFAAGIGMTYELTPEHTLFGGVYQGISIPGPNARLADDIDEEKSISYEGGLRTQTHRFQSEIAVFYTDFSNLVGTDTGLALSGGSNLNAGEALVRGVEIMVGSDLGSQKETLSIPVYLSATYTDAELQNDLASGGSENIYAGGTAGAALPYVPEWKLAFGIGFNQGAGSLRLNGTWTDESYGTARNLDAPESSSREGKIDGGLVLDLSGSWELTETISVFTGIRNLLDETLLTSRLPEGPRNASPRTLYGGIQIIWGADGE